MQKNKFSCDIICATKGGVITGKKQKTERNWQHGCLTRGNEEPQTMASMRGFNQSMSKKTGSQRRAPKKQTTEAKLDRILSGTEDKTTINQKGDGEYSWKYSSVGEESTIYQKENRKQMSILDQIFATSVPTNVETIEVDGEKFDILPLTGYDIIAVSQKDPAETAVYVLSKGLIYNGSPLGPELARKMMDVDWKLATIVSTRIISRSVEISRQLSVFNQ